jgi:hypothetical protein
MIAGPQILSSKFWTHPYSTLTAFSVLLSPIKIQTSFRFLDGMMRIRCPIESLCGIVSHPGLGGGFFWKAKEPYFSKQPFLKLGGMMK